MTMQPEELKALRQRLGMSQQAFADAIGMGREAVNKMESGKLPIERRTELAARYVALREKVNGCENAEVGAPLERAARALCEVVGRDPDEVCIGEGKATGQTWMGWEAMLSDARKVIEAIREPSEGMATAGQKAAVIALHRDGGYRMQDTWSAMIDTLLAEDE